MMDLLFVLNSTTHLYSHWSAFELVVSRIWVVAYLFAVASWDPLLFQTCFLYFLLVAVLVAVDVLSVAECLPPVFCARHYSSFLGSP